MFDIKRIIKAAQYSKAGFIVAWQEEKAFRDDTALVILGLGVSSAYSNTLLEFFISLLSLILLLIVELLNTGLENLADKISMDFCAYCKAAKDLGSAAVFLILIFVFSYHTFLIVT